MNHRLGWICIVGAIDSGNTRAKPGDDLVAAELIVDRDRVGLGRRIIALLHKGVSACRAQRSKRPESLEEALARLESISPHLPADIGFKAVGGYPPAGTPRRRKEWRRIDCSGGDPAAMTLEHPQPNPFREAGQTRVNPIGHLAAAE
ncbi:MAG: hypothetical protein INF48_02130 [Rhodobacter sp.]|nr:hypothetical protein [Rhodobacter sp.]